MPDDQDLFGNELPRTASRRGKHYIEPRGYAHHPGTGPQDETCGSCKHRVVRGGRYSKCLLARAIWTHSRRSDILATSVACSKWEAAPKPDKPNRATAQKSRAFVQRTQEHHCHARGCTIAVPPAMFMCKRHWFMLPKPMRDAIWQTYRKGQEIDKSPSAAYLDNARAAILWLAEKEGK